jgi:tetratricopeptide (TPR) repeat protein
VIRLIREIKNEFPSQLIWCSGRLHEFTKLEEEWKVLRGIFKREKLPDFLERGDIKKFLCRMDDLLNEEIREAILQQGKLPAIHLAVIYKHLKIKDFDPSDLTRKILPESKKVYQAMYDTLDEEEKVCLKLLSFLDKVTPEVLADILKKFLVNPHLINHLILQGVIYKDITYRIVPYLETLNILDAFHDLKEIAREDTSEEERNEFLQKMFSIHTVELLLSIQDKFPSFSREQKRKYLSILKSNAEDIRALWIASIFSDQEGDLLKLSDYAIRKANKSEEKSFARVLFNFGYGHAMQGSVDQSIKCYREGIKIYPRDAKAWYNLGILYRKKGYLKESIKSYRKALKIDGNYALAWFNLAIAYRFSGEMEKAIECYEKAIEINPEFADAWHTLGSEDMKRLEAELEIEQMRRKLENNPNDAKTWYNLSFLYMRSGKISEAIESYEKAIGIDPKYELDWSWIDVKHQIKPKDEAVKIVERYEKMDIPTLEESEAWPDLGFLYGKRDEPEKAISYFKKAVEEEPENALEWYNLGVAHGEKGEVEEEIRCYRKATSLNPRFLNAWYNLGVAYGELKQTEEEISCYEKVLTINPKHTKAWYNLSVAYGEKGEEKKEQECLQMYEKLSKKERIE